MWYMLVPTCLYSLKLDSSLATCPCCQQVVPKSIGCILWFFKVYGWVLREEKSPTITTRFFSQYLHVQSSDERGWISCWRNRKYRLNLGNNSSYLDTLMIKRAISVETTWWSSQHLSSFLSPKFVLILNSVVFTAVLIYKNVIPLNNSKL